MSIRIVIVDDSNLVRERLVKMLNATSGIEIAGEATNSYDALRVIQDKKPHIVIIDIKIPGENGMEVLKKIKKVNKAVIAIIITNYPITQYRTNCFENGADYFYDKSYEYGKVVETIEGLVNSGSVEHVVNQW
jgi:DNA-binding NarL/FixJ family response regulator